MLRQFCRAALTVVCVMGGLVHAESFDADPANYAFANYFGSGFYQASGRNVVVLNIPLRFDAGESDGVIMRWRLPVSIGFFDFTFDDIDVPERADTLTVIPGMEWQVPMSEQWYLLPYIDLGWGKNFSRGEEHLVYSTGLSSHYSFGEDLHHQWVNRLFYAGYHGLSYDVDDGFSTFQSGLEWRLPWQFQLNRREAFINTYGVGQWHFDKLEFIVPDSDAKQIQSNIEIGMTLGVERPYELLGFELNRVGLGYRFVDGLRLWRITVNSPL